jgi:flagellar biogenesis protein FliO
MFSLADTLTQTPPEVAIPGYEGAFIKMFLTLLGLLVGIFFTVWALKRFSQGKMGSQAGARTLKLIEKKPLSPKTMLYVVELEGKQVLLAESQLEIKNLMTLEKESEEVGEKP